MWVITRSINDYNQDGDYFVSVFDHKPSVEELKKLLRCGDEYAKNLENGGGRYDGEGEWHHLTEMGSGVIY